jgi:hypothetical protein
LSDKFEDLTSGKTKFKIWVISIDGALIIGDEHNNCGHPTLTNFKSARIAGELHYQEGKWIINAKSGRYSSNYGSKSNEYLGNARLRFLEVFAQCKPDDIIADLYKE